LRDQEFIKFWYSLSIITYLSLSTINRFLCLAKHHLGVTQKQVKISYSDFGHPQHVTGLG